LKQIKGRRNTQLEPQPETCHPSSSYFYSIIERDLGNDTMKRMSWEYGEEDSRQAEDETRPEKMKVEEKVEERGRKEKQRDRGRETERETERDRETEREKRDPLALTTRPSTSEAKECNANSQNYIFFLKFYVAAIPETPSPLLRNGYI
jgi:hypothetical protein